MAEIEIAYLRRIKLTFVSTLYALLTYILSFATLDITRQTSSYISCDLSKNVFFGDITFYIRFRRDTQGGVTLLDLQLLLHSPKSKLSQVKSCRNVTIDIKYS